MMKINILIDFLLDLVCSNDNIKIQDEGTLFESKCPILVVDVITKDDSYIDLRNLKSINDIKILYIKNQLSNQKLTLNTESFLSVKKMGNSLFIKYKKDDDSEIFELEY